MPQGPYGGGRLVGAGFAPGHGRGNRGQGDSVGRNYQSPSLRPSPSLSTVGGVVPLFQCKREMMDAEKKINNACHAARCKRGTTAEERHETCQTKGTNRLVRKAKAKAAASFEVGNKRGIQHRQQATVSKKPNEETFRRPQSPRSAHVKAVPKKTLTECPRAPIIRTAQGVEGGPTTVKRTEELSDAEKMSYHLEIFHGIDVINLD